MEITNLAKALVKAQAEMSGAKKDSTNPHFRSKYADLASVDAAIGPAAATNGLGYYQVVHERENAAAVETVIVHESGETLPCGIVSVPVTKADAQGYGSAMTYARRYSLSAAFGVCPEDDDGNAAAKAAPSAPKAVAKPNTMPAKEHVDHCTAMSDAVDMGDEELLKTVFATAYKAAKGYNDEAAMHSIQVKYEQCKAMLQPVKVAA